MTSEEVKKMNAWAMTLSSEERKEVIRRLKEEKDEYLQQLLEQVNQN